MSRRRTKTERELIADLMDGLRVFCNSQSKCSDCPLHNIKTEHEQSCIRAYALYIIDNKGDDK